MEAAEVEILGWRVAAAVRAAEAAVVGIKKNPDEYEPRCTPVGGRVVRRVVVCSPQRRHHQPCRLLRGPAFAEAPAQVLVALAELAGMVVV